MTPVLLLFVLIGLVSFGGAAYLLTVWHEDRASGTRGWPLTRVVAYLAIAGTLASNHLAGLTVLRLSGNPRYPEVVAALTPMTIVALLVLLALFPILAAYLRVVRATGYMTASERSGLATEASVREAISAARDAYHEANTVNQKIATLTEALGHKQDAP